MKITAIILFTILSVLVFANDFMQPAQIAIDDQHQITCVGKRTGHREQDPPPEYSFILNGNGAPTTFLIHSYYDYMPFSYNGQNVRIQPEISMPYGYQAGGIYITYMRSETPNAGFDRRAYFSYITSDGTLGESDNINSDIIREGFTSCAIDPYTADPFAVWHASTEPNGSYDSHMSYFLFHAVGNPNWRTPFIVIDNPEMSLPFTGHNDDEFIWPQVHIGPSPIPDHRRVHVYGNNFNSSGGGGPNSLYLFADFDNTDLLSTSDLDWTVQSFPYFDEIHYNDIARINKDMIVSEVDGKVVFFGNVADSLFALYSNDYGETFTKYTHQLLQQLPNLLINGQPMFEDDWFALPTNDLTHYNGLFTDDNSKVQWMSGVTYNSQENINMGYYISALIYPKIFTFVTSTGEFSFYDLDIQDTDPGDDHLAVAYDLNDDGVYDGSFPVSYPSWCFDGMYHYRDESNCKMTSNENWVVCVWHDCAKLYNAYHEEPGYEGWVEQPEICIVISDDSGETWSDIRYINANPNDAIVDSTYHYDGNYAPEFEGMLPVNVTLGDKLEILSNDPDNYHAKLHFAFMDDGDYGSAVQGNGSFTNSQLCYAAIDLEFQEEWIDPVSVDPEIVPSVDIKLTNYPNPFNPETTILFSVTQNSDFVTLEIYNIKGQKVKTFTVNLSGVEGERQVNVVWNGTDENNKPVSSGIYMYQLKVNGKAIASNKCLLLK
ncbi:MAG: FlgD immunoglobulin-like domain containing protein [Candidatus Cloacimonadota bacterium]|nr:FlgD immunoglobulin-like domain containing protein [Candidatus Cloacimonadota bacterium]